MKNKIKQKLRSRRGVTILMALLFLLLCTMVGSVVITSAGASTDTLAGRKELQADYLAMSSAIRFLEETLDGKSCEAIETEERYQCRYLTNIVGTPPKHAEDVQTWVQSMTMADADGKLQTYIQNLADGFIKANPKYHTKDLPSAPTMPVQFEITGEGMPPVNVEMIMGRNYQLTFTLTVSGSAYKTILVFSAAMTEDEQSAKLPCGHYVLPPEGGPKIWRDFEGTKMTNITKVTWTQSSLTKGAGTI